MSLEVILGPMFSGKSSYLQAVVRRHVALQWRVFAITHASDVRYATTTTTTTGGTSTDGAIISHDRVHVPATAVAELLPLLQHPSFLDARLVLVEEATFFGDLVEFVTAAVETHGKHVVVGGLDGDCNRRPFGALLQLVPLADRVTKLSALCAYCGDGTPAVFTAARVPNARASAAANVPLVGGAETYTPMCRRHYLAQA